MALIGGAAHTLLVRSPDGGGTHPSAVRKSAKKGLIMLRTQVAKKLFLSFSALVFLSGYFLSSESSGTERLAALYSSNSVSYSFPWIAKEAGLFRKYNLEPDIVYIPASAIATAALLSDGVELAMAGGVGFVRAFVRGATDIVFIGSFKNFLTISVVAKPEIKRPEDLKGRKIGVTRLGSNSHYFAVQALRRLGLDPARDVTFIQIGAETEILTALIKGLIDAGSIPPPLDARALALGFQYIAYGPDVGILYPAANIVTRRSVIAKRPEVLGRFMQAMAEASKILHTDREFTYKVLAKLFRVSDRKLLDHAYGAEIKVMERRLDFRPEGIQVILEEISQIDPRAKRVKPQDLLDRRYLDEMEKSGFFAQLWTEKH